MAAGNQQKHLEFTFSIEALSFHSRTSIRTHKYILPGVRLPVEFQGKEASASSQEFTTRAQKEQSLLVP